jgi:hypothetical protein
MTNRWLARLLLLWACLALPLESIALALPTAAKPAVVAQADLGHHAMDHAMPCCDSGDCGHCADAGMPSGHCAAPCAIAAPTAIASARHTLAQAVSKAVDWPPLPARRAPPHSLRLDRPPAA